LRILILHNRYKSNNIGGEDVVFDNEVILLKEKLGKSNVFSYEVSNDNINKFKLLFGIWFSIKNYFEVSNIIKKEKIDIVHIHNFFPLLTPSIFKASKDAGVKVVHTLHNYRLWCLSGTLYREKYGICELCTMQKYPIKGILFKCYRNSMIQSLMAQFSFWIYRLFNAFNNIDYYFVLSNFQKEKIKQFGIDEKKIVLKPNTLKISKNLENKKEGYIFVGRLEEHKGIHNLLNDWVKLDERFVLTIIGSGDKDKTLENSYDQNNINFKGKCTRHETLEYISKSKYLIQPSVMYETFGLSIIEAMSYGVPVIGYDIGTRGDFIEDGVNGFISTENSLLKVIKKSYNAENYELLSKNAVKRARLFENDYIIKMQIDHYQKILNNDL